MEKFEWLWKPIGVVHVSMWEMTSIPPRWTIGDPTQPKQAQIDV